MPHRRTNAALAVAHITEVLSCDCDKFDRLVALLQDADLDYFRQLLLEEHQKEWNEFYLLFEVHIAFDQAEEKIKEQKPNAD
jgi:hypothetical protein